MPDLLEELKWRGLLKDCTDEAGLREHLAAGPRTVYCGFDPTAPSLTIGNLVPIMMLRHFKEAGHRVIVLQGGATGRIGDPSGKEAERAMRTEDEVQAQLEAQTAIFKNVLGGDVAIVDNFDWFKGMGFLQVLRDVGKHFSISQMIKRDSVANRLEREQGISYTEFSYMLLQAYDFLHLFRAEGCTVQMAGADQWGNIVSGVDLIDRDRAEIAHRFVTPIFKMADYSRGSKFAERIGEPPGASDDTPRGLAWEIKAHQLIQSFVPTVGEKSTAWGNRRRLKAHTRDTNPEIRACAEECLSLIEAYEAQAAFGLVAPLLLKSDGSKFGKTEAGAIWLSSPSYEGFAGTSAYAFSQFWLNADDADVPRFLRTFTLLPRAEIEELERLTNEEPHQRAGQKALAHHVTALVHGEEARDRAEAAASALFSGEVAGLDEATLNEVFAAAPSTEHPRASLAGEGVALVDLLPETSLAQSKRESREFLTNGAVSVNGVKVALDARLTESSLLHDRVALIRRGKKKWHVTRWV